MARVAVVDTGPLIALAGIDQLSLLDALFDRVLVTFDVWMELAAKAGAAEPSLVAELRSVKFVPTPQLASRAEAYGPGEQSVLAIAALFPTAIAVLDERNRAAGGHGQRASTSQDPSVS